jgi:hypothetical protein
VTVAARAELVDALALLLQLRDVGAMGQRFQALVAPAIERSRETLGAKVDAWIASEAKN